MPKIKVLPHAEICPHGAEFEAESGISVCENLLNQNIDGTNKIVDAKFKTYGCGSAIASSGELIDMLKGKTLEEAQNISNQEIVDILELPAIKIHCSVLAEEAIHRAIDDFKSRRNND